MILEIPVFSVDDALVAVQYGAGRLELCTSYLEGGLTPGPGLLNYVKQKVSVPVFVMIRPRAGNFFYSADDIRVMKEEIRIFSDLGADGFVFGVLNRYRTVDMEACKELVSLAGNLPCTFHRAFDEVADPEKALQDIVECGFVRILTSGHPENVDSGRARLKLLLKRAENQITIIPGGGLRPGHLKELYSNGLLKEVHASCRINGGADGDTSQGDSAINPCLINRFIETIDSLTR